jgi:hypothetical protein
LVAESENFLIQDGFFFISVSFQQRWCPDDRLEFYLDEEDSTGKRASDHLNSAPGVAMSAAVFRAVPGYFTATRLDLLVQYASQTRFPNLNLAGVF